MPFAIRFSIRIHCSSGTNDSNERVSSANLSTNSNDKVLDRRRLPRSEETKKKISEAMKNRKLSLAHRYKIGSALSGRQLTDDHKAKIAASESATKQRIRVNRLGEYAGAAASAATADLRPALNRKFGSAARLGAQQGKAATQQEVDSAEDWIGKEKAVIEMVALRKKLKIWMDDYEARTGQKPDLTETSQTDPAVYAAFVRYVALRQLIRDTFTGGESEVTWE